MILFFVLAYVVAWAAFVPGAALANAGGALAQLSGVLFLLGAISPAFVAIALVARTPGTSAVVPWLRSLFERRASAGWYILAVAFMVTLKLLAAVLFRIATGDWPRFGETPWYLMAAGIFVSMWVQAGEEIGWRGYALPRLAASLGLGSASVVLGVIWALWHLPLFFVAIADTYHRPLALYVLQVTALSIIMAWLYWRAGTLLPVMLFHATVNNTKDIVPSDVPATGLLSLTATPMAWLTVGLLWLVALPLLWRMRAAVLDGHLASESGGPVSLVESASTRPPSDDARIQRFSGLGIQRLAIRDSGIQTVEDVGINSPPDVR